ncbi:hypothetical protein IV203_015273 [Nitzschia inconspicua]|uniref:Nuclear segregation protein n=1 Tax=Nitzschia inconspicua TaxID=303405 RepID=A0A9K3K632_9STRA|nr:hypothetical protein IV203_020228 [Nitzschia inconspicua]KAG7358684.1 hypothetical protein IV203_015273 [Nitzschia inconspicua]
MAEEESKTPPATNGDAATKDNGGTKPNNNRKQQKPIEELYDLSKPIPKVEKPNKSELDAKVDALTSDFEKLKTAKNKIQEKIEAAMGAGKNTEIGKAKDAMAALKTKKNKMIEEKRVIRAKLDALKSQGDKLQKDKKDAKSSVKFSSVEEINKEIAKLQRLQETTSMSLNEEKKLIKEMDALKASKDKIKDVADKEVGLADVKQQRTLISDMIKAKDKEIDAITKEMDEIGSKIKALAEKETDKKSSLDGLYKERDKLRKDISAVLKEKDTVRDEFRKKQDVWWDYQRAVKAQKKIQYEEERKKREEEKAAYLKKLEEEELKKIPYEEEQGLCDYLADYLERTYLGSGVEGGEKVTAKKEDVVEVKDDPFSGLKPVNKKSEEEYFGKGKGKKKRQRAPKKAETAGPFTLNVDTFEQFGLIGMNPPTSLDQVESTVKELREKKEWYKQQPRGSVPTAKEIRKQNEKNAAKLRQGSAAPATPSGSKGDASGKFSLSSDDFVPLGKGASTAVDSSSWGQKPTSDGAAAAADES